MRRMTLFAALALALMTPTAQAGPPGKWTQVTGLGQDDLNIMRAGVARTGDGVLHVLWTRNEAGNAASVLHSTVSADAKTVSGPNTVFTNPDGVNETVDLARAPDGSLRAFFSATNVFDSGMATATSSDGGASWSVGGPISRREPQGKPVYAASGIGGAIGADGTVYSIWGDSSPGGGGYHVGLDPNAPDGELPGGLKSDPGLGIEAATGQVVAGWNSMDDEGVVLMGIPGGVPAAIPNSAADLQHQVAITGRIGAPGVFVAFGQGTNPLLADPAVYRVDTGVTKRLTKRDGELVSIAAGPAGRLWVFWKDGGTIFATRSDPDAVNWGRIVRVKAPKKADTIYDLVGEGSPGPLDLLAHVDPPTGTLSSWHRRILPGLSIKTKVTKGDLEVRVSDAGAPVSGAKVKVSEEGSKTTGAGGSVTFEDVKKGKHKVRASRDGYAPVAKRVKVG